MSRWLRAMRADGALNHRDFYAALTLALTRYMDGDEPAANLLSPAKGSD